MINVDGVTPNYKQNVIISVNTLIDVDTGLFKLIRDEYLDPNVFNAKYFTESSIVDFITTTYYRIEDNPLYPVSIIHDKDVLDSYYIEFMQTQYNEIYDKSVYTDVLPMIELFIDSKEIDVTILYYRDHALEKLQRDQEAGKINKAVKFVPAKDIKAGKLNEYNQIYIRSVNELDVLPIKQLMSPKTFYISTFGPNYNIETGKIKRTSGLNDIITSKLMHELVTFDMYSNKNMHHKREKKKGV